MKSVLIKLHWLNLDTALGAAITSLFVADYLQVKIPVVASATLLIAVLAIYNFDHLMDARRLTSISQSARHRFYQLNQKPLSVYQLILMLGLITIIWYLPEDILRAGLVLALVTGIYFILLFFIFPGRFLIKEIMIAIVYSLALFLAPLYSGQVNVEQNIWQIMWLEIFLLAVANTLIFSWYDYDIDLQEGHDSLAGALGQTMIYRTIIILLIALVLLSGYQLVTNDSTMHQLTIMSMTFILFYSILARTSMKKNDRYRIIGDAVFLIPAFALLL